MQHTHTHTQSVYINNNKKNGNGVEFSNNTKHTIPYLVFLILLYTDTNHLSCICSSLAYQTCFNFPRHENLFFVIVFYFIWNGFLEPLTLDNVYAQVVYEQHNQRILVFMIYFLPFMVKTKNHLRWNVQKKNFLSHCVLHLVTKFLLFTHTHTMNATQYMIY